MRIVAALVGAVVCSVAALNATVVLPIEFRELVTSSAVIVQGRVTDTRSVFIDERRSVDTFVTVAVEQYLKGNLGDHVTIRVPGGDSGRYRTVYVGAPRFEPGNDVVLFLKNDAGRVPVIVGLSQGAFRVMADPSGRRLVTTPILMSRGGETPQRIVRGDPARQPIPIETFRQVVRRVLADGARQ